jgi:hypothetical protein
MPLLEPIGEIEELVTAEPIDELNDHVNAVDRLRARLGISSTNGGCTRR